MQITYLSSAISESDNWVHPDRLWHEGFLVENHVLQIDEGRIADIVLLEDVPENASITTLHGIVTPGFVDLQVNGGAGVMLNNMPTPEGVLTIARAHRPGGTVGILPTVITDRPEITRKAAEAVMSVHGREGVLGIHIEGPHINPERKGTHDPELMRPLDEETFSLVETLRTNEVPVMLTLAPELTKPGQIAQLAKMGVIVSAGHSNATADQIDLALSEGLSAFTHLFNGMSQMSGREPGVVGAALAGQGACGIILDGHHVDPRMARIAFASRPNGGEMFIVSDAMSTWNGPDHFELYGERIQVQDGRLVNQQGSLAGAHIDMAGSVRIALKMGLSLEQALCSAIDVPRNLIGVCPTWIGDAGVKLRDLLLISNPLDPNH